MESNNIQESPVLAPVGVDKVIRRIADSLSCIDWLTNVYSRAYRLPDIAVSTKAKTKYVPQIYKGKTAYDNVLINDNYKAMSFVVSDGGEVFLDENDLNNADYEANKTRNLALICWFNLEKIDAGRDFIFTEELKTDVEVALSEVDGVNIRSVIDEDYTKVFEGFEFVENKYLKYPYGAFRFNITAVYGGSKRDC